MIYNFLITIFARAAPNIRGQVITVEAEFEYISNNIRKGTLFNPAPSPLTLAKAITIRHRQYTMIVNPSIGNRGECLQTKLIQS